jgi:hypothetical protein
VFKQKMYFSNYQKVAYSEFFNFENFCAKILLNSNFKVRNGNRRSELDLRVFMFSDERCLLVMLRKWHTQNLKILKILKVQVIKLKLVAVFAYWITSNRHILKIMEILIFQKKIIQNYGKRSGIAISLAKYKLEICYWYHFLCL